MLFAHDDHNLGITLNDLALNITRAFEMMDEEALSEDGLGKVQHFRDWYT